jgi:hypothetical protein
VLSDKTAATISFDNKHYPREYFSRGALNNTSHFYPGIRLLKKAQIYPIGAFANLFFHRIKN